MKKTKKVQLLGDFPQSDWNQTDETNSEFIKNKPTLGALASKDKVAKGDLTAELQASLGTSSGSIGGVETDPTVPDWAKTPDKPEYTASEVEAVAYTAQILTEEQKRQARSNIGAGTSSFSGNYKDLIDTPIIPSTDELATTIYVDGQLDTKVDKVAGKGLSTNDFTDAYRNKVDGALQTYTESDPTVPMWAKASSKPTYTASEVGAISYDVAQILTEEQKAQARDNIGANSFSGNYNDLINQPNIPSVEGLATTEYVNEKLADKVDKVTGKGLSTNDFTDSYKKKVDSALQSYTESDPTVPLWAKASSKPTYTANEVGSISYDVAQVLTEEQKARARANIGAISSSFSGDYDDLINKPNIPSIEGLARIEYVDEKVASVVDSAPEALNTLNELAAALGNDKNFATTVTNQIGKLEKALDDKQASGSYSTIGHKHTKSEITDFPTLAAVATSGSYNDLSDKPPIPTTTTVDSVLSSTSTNPVQNKVINTALAGKAELNHGTHVTYSDATPKANGDASAGTATTVSRTDHRHPLQTTVSGSSGSCTGNAATATKFNSPRKIELTGDVVGSVTTDGASGWSINTTITDDSHNHTTSDVNGLDDTLTTLQTRLNSTIRYDVVQSLTEAQKAQARANIGATTNTSTEVGADGFSPIATVSKTGKTATITITDKSGTTTANISDGLDGESVTVKSVTESTADGGSNVVTFSDGKTLTVRNGSKGGNGSNGVSCTHSWNGTTLTVTSASGTSSADLKGQDGTSVGIKSISQSTEYGGSNIITFTDNKTLTILNGSGGGGGGTSGTATTITSISESTEDGGSNVVTFSDGNTLTIKNGQRGSDGVSCTHSWDGTTLTITSASGTTSADLKGESISILSIEEPGSYQDEQIVLGVEKITSDTYANETTYPNEEFIALRIFPKTNGTVTVTYGGLTKTITDTSGEESPSAQTVFFGTFNGVSDEVATPATGRLTIEGDYNSFGCGTFYSSEQNASEETSTACACIIAVINCGRITSLPGRAFAGCEKLTSIAIPDSVATIGLGVFMGCAGLKSVKIPDSVTEIGMYAFAYCTSLSSIVIPASVTKINSQAFYLVSGYSRTVIMQPTTPPTLAFMGLNTFHALGTNNIIVPTGCGEAYKTASYWSQYADYITEGDIFTEEDGGSYTRVYFSDGSILRVKNGDSSQGGTSVSISSILQSTEDGGSNVVTFSDGKTLTIKNGSKGSTPVKGTDYYTEADKEEMVALVLAALPSASGVSF